jgi:hypothetical protein
VRPSGICAGAGPPCGFCDSTRAAIPLTAGQHFTITHCCRAHPTTVDDGKANRSGPAQVGTTRPLARKKVGKFPIKNFQKTGEKLLHGHSQRTYMAELLGDLNYYYSQRLPNYIR